MNPRTVSELYLLFPKSLALYTTLPCAVQLRQAPVPSRPVKLKCEFHVPEKYSDSVALWNLLSATGISDPHAYGKFKNLKQAGCGRG